MAAMACNAAGTSVGQPTPEVTPSHSAPLNSAWRTDLPEGGSIGDVAPNARVTLGDGSTATLEELAEAVRCSCYFFATW